MDISQLVHAVDNCPQCGQIHILLTIIHNQDKCPWYGQLFILFYQLSMPQTQNTFFCRKIKQIIFSHSHGQNQSEKKSSWTIIFFSDPVRQVPGKTRNGEDWSWLAKFTLNSASKSIYFQFVYFILCTRREDKVNKFPFRFHPK